MAESARERAARLQREAEEARAAADAEEQEVIDRAIDNAARELADNSPLTLAQAREAIERRVTGGTGVTEAAAEAEREEGGENPPEGGEENPPEGGEENPPEGGEENPPEGGEENPPEGGGQEQSPPPGPEVTPRAEHPYYRKRSIRRNRDAA